MTEIELSVMSRPCLGRRLPDRAVLEREIVAWQTERNALGGCVDWRFTADDERIKLRRRYPDYQEDGHDSPPEVDPDRDGSARG